MKYGIALLFAAMSFVVCKSEGQSVAILWKNGIVQNLSVGTTDAIGSFVFVK